MQQQMFKQWVSRWPGMPAPGVPPALGPRGVDKEVGSDGGELIKKQRETLESAVHAGPEEHRGDVPARRGEGPRGTVGPSTVELWQKSIDCLRQT